MSTLATDDDEQQPVGGRGRVRRHVGSPAVGWSFWLTSVICLVVLTVWLFSDSTFHTWDAAQAARSAPPFDLLAGPLAARLGPRVALLWVLWLGGALATVGAFVALFAGARAHRRLRWWLVFVLLVALWLTLAVGWRELAWQGQRFRLWTRLGDFAPLAASLRDDWPTVDGDRAGLGAFSAYPIGRPWMLLVLSSPTNPAVSAVERGDVGALRFELRGHDRGAWLEWHPAGSQPQSFTGGLENQYHLVRATPLGGGWYLVRYR